MSFIRYISRTYCSSVDGLNIILLGSWRKKKAFKDSIWHGLITSFIKERNTY